MSVKNMKKLLLLGHTGFVGKKFISYANNIKLADEIIGKSTTEINLLLERDLPKLIPFFTPDTSVVMFSGLKSDRGNTMENFRNNVRMAENVAAVLKENPVKKFIFFSSVAVYGVDVSNPAITEATPPQPDTYYSLSKYVSECLLQIASRACGNIELVAFRTPTIYGPGEDVVAHTPSGFLKTYRSGSNITLWGDGSDRREFIFVDDIVRLLERLLFCSYSGVLNIGTGTGHSYREALDVVGKILNKELLVNTKQRSKPKIDKIVNPVQLRVLFPDFYFTSLADGLESTYLSDKSENRTI